MQATLTADGDMLDFVLVTLFGERHDIDPLTKKFSLFKAQS
jgi:hypothetical protein